MPQPGLPPTPASSTDLLAKECAKHTVEHGFSLGPPAIRSAESSESSNASVKSDSSYKPSTSPTGSRKRPRTAEDQETHRESVAGEQALPPPPTRSRRIIQMKPQGSDKNKQAATGSTRKSHTRTPSTTTASGKKTARKTAHSIIERRRRSKMNEEFETLKSMIPACNGQQMHKLAILQAGIDYMRYLEQCITNLQGGASRSTQPPPSVPQSQAATPRAQSMDGSESEDDVEMVEQDKRIPSYASSTMSPAILPQGGQSNPSVSSTYSLTTPSPAFGPRNDSWSSIDQSRPSYSLSTTTSPAILPQIAVQDAAEASAALLMLNHDRRHSRSDRPTGLSVKDLLSH